MIHIGNNGAEIADTNYWTTEPGLRGLCYLSGNAGVWRLLVPPSAEYMMPDMRTGKRVTIERSIRPDARALGSWDIVFEDGSQSPFCLTLDPRMVDRTVDSGACRLTVWTSTGKQIDLPCEIRIGGGG